MTPEAKAREQIDQKLEGAGWVIQDLKQLNLGAGLGVAVREYPTDTGPADYVLFVNRNACGVIEAKKDDAGENLTATEGQTERYAAANLKWRKDNTPLRFLFEATGQIIRFTDNADPAPRSRELFHFFKPEQFAEWLAQAATLRRRVVNNMPPLPVRNLRNCQVSAVTGLEKSLAQNKPRALIHMATGAGKCSYFMQGSNHRALPRPRSCHTDCEREAGAFAGGGRQHAGRRVPGRTHE